MIPKQEPISLREAGKFLKDIKDVPFPTLLAGFGFILILIDIPIYEISGKSQLSGYGVVFIVFGLIAYQNRRTKTSKKRKR